MQNETLQEELTRFQQVLKARKTPRDLLELFEKLSVSEKFSREAKPECFMLLIQEAARRVPGAQLPVMLGELTTLGTVEMLFNEIEKDRVHALFLEVTKQVLSGAPKTTKGMMAAFRGLELSGISSGRVDTIDMALKSGIDEDTVGAWCDLTFQAYYHPEQVPELAEA